MALTKLDLSVIISDKLGVNRNDSKDIVELFFEEIRKALERGENVHLSGFGNFDLRDKNPRPGRNPKTGKPYEVTARRVVTFHAGLKLKARVQYYNSEKNEDSNGKTTS